MATAQASSQLNFCASVWPPPHHGEERVLQRTVAAQGRHRALMHEASVSIERKLVNLEVHHGQQLVVTRADGGWGQQVHAADEGQSLLAGGQVVEQREVLGHHAGAAFDGQRADRPIRIPWPHFPPSGQACPRASQSHPYRHQSYWRRDQHPDAGRHRKNQVSQWRYYRRHESRAGWHPYDQTLRRDRQSTGDPPGCGPEAYGPHPGRSPGRPNVDPGVCGGLDVGGQIHKRRIALTPGHGWGQ